MMSQFFPVETWGAAWGHILPRMKPLERGVVLQRTSLHDNRQQYFLYIPQRGGAQAKIFISVHGISRNAVEHAQRFSAFAETYGVVMIAPYFPESDYPDYQRLGRKGKRADKVLDTIVEEVSRLTGADSSKLYLFGYSGGAQFVHRYMLAYPQRVARVVLGAPGWYTFPDATQSFPKGIKVSRDFADIEFRPTQFLQVPACVLVGENDDQRDNELNQSPRIDGLQGKTRIERGRRWIRAMTSQARQHGLLTPYHFELLPGSSHSFSMSMQRGAMGVKAFDFLFSDAGIAVGKLHQ